jgi:hypothetical protein
LRHEETDHMSIRTTVDRKAKFRSLWSGLKRKAYGILLGKSSIASVQQFLLLNWRIWRKIRIGIRHVFQCCQRDF